MMFGHPAHQDHGTATSLLSTVEAAAGEQRLYALFTEASLTARPFFERGFELVAQQETAIRGQRLRDFRICEVLGQTGSLAR